MSQNNNSSKEIVIGLIAPIGVDLKTLQERLENKLINKFRYKTQEIKLSKFIERFKNEDYANNPTFDRYSNRITAGNELRKKFEKKSLLALAGICQIAVNREKSDSSSVNNEQKKVAYIINQLKTPEELEAFKHVYGERFFSLAIIADKSLRVKNLLNKMNLEALPNEKPVSPEARVNELFYEDDIKGGRQKNADSTFKQYISGTLDKADYYIEDVNNIEVLDYEIKRFLERIHNRPYRGPNTDEYAMSVAFNAALRSLDMGQQIGCCIASEDGEIISTGFNEVPSPGGKPWPTPDGRDERDYATSEYSLTSIRKEYENGLVSSLREHFSEAGINFGEEIEEIVQRGFSSIIEFGRSVHAEMAALIEAARLGKSVEGKVLYTTTYPCHLCTKNIIASGIKKVVYLKHYSKSRATRMFPYLHEDLFRPYLGVSPRVYGKIYSYYYDKGLKDKNGKRLNWDPGTDESYNYASLNPSYRMIEKIAGGFLKQVIQSKAPNDYEDILTEELKKFLNLSCQFICATGFEYLYTEYNKIFK